MPSSYVLTVTAAVVVVAVVLVVRARLHPSVVLVAAALAIGLLTGLGVEGSVKAVTEGFGDILAEIGLLIAFGVLIGSLLQAAGAIDAVVRALFERSDTRRMPAVFALACATVLQPIFIDVLIVIVAPLIRRVAPRLGPGGIARMASALTVGCACGVMMVVPGVGCLALAGVLDVPLGRMLLLGLVVALPTVVLTTVGVGAVLVRWWDPTRDETVDAAAPEPSVAARSAAPGQAEAPCGPEAEPRSAGAGLAAPAPDGVLRLPVLLAPLLGALALIAAGAVAAALGVRPPVLAFLATPTVALLLGALGTVAATRRVLGPAGLERALGDGFRQMGLILVLTGVGGALAEVISRAGLGRALEGLFSAHTAVPLLAVWVIAAVLHLAIGSGTLSAITAAGVLAPVVGPAGLDPGLVALAAGAGGLFAVHVTSNTFWLLQSLLGQSVRGTLKTCSVALSAASVLALVLVLALDRLV